MVVNVFLRVFFFFFFIIIIFFNLKTCFDVI
jgi:hypothetical protein